MNQKQKRDASVGKTENQNISSTEDRSHIPWSKDNVEKQLEKIITEQELGLSFSSFLT